MRRKTLGMNEATRIAHNSLAKISPHRYALMSGSGTLRDYISTGSQLHELLAEVATQVRRRGFSINEQYLSTLDPSSNVHSLAKAIFMSLPGDEDFEEPSDT